MIRALFKRSSIYFFGLSLGKFLSVAVFILYARILLPAGFGDLVLYSTLGQIVTFLGDFGLNQWYQKKVHTQDRKVLFSQLINARSITLVSSLLVAGLFLKLVPTFKSGVILVFLTTMIPDAFQSVVDGFYFDLKNSFKVSLKTIFRMTLLLIGYLIFKNNFSFYRAAQIYLVSSIMILLWYFPWSKLKSFEFISLSRSFGVLRSSFSYAFFVLTSYAYARGDSIVVRYALNSTALGLYGGAYRFLEGLALIPTALSHNLFPLSAKESNVTWQHILKITIIMTIVGALTGILLFASSRWLVFTLLGNAYLAAVPLLQIFALVVVLFFISMPLNTVVLSSSLINKFLPWGFANTVLNIVLNIVFVPIFGILAAAWVMLATEITGLLINIYFIRRVYK